MYFKANGTQSLLPVRSQTQHSYLNEKSWCNATEEVPGLAYGGSTVHSLAPKQIEEEIIEQEE